MRGIRTLLRGVFGHCLMCGRGRVFNSFYGLNPACSQCGAHFHQDGSPTVGAMIITMFVPILLGFSGGVVLVIAVGVDDVMLGLLAWLLILTVVSAIFYRFACGLWVGITTLPGANEKG